MTQIWLCATLSSCRYFQLFHGFPFWRIKKLADAAYGEHLTPLFARGDSGVGSKSTQLFHVQGLEMFRWSMMNPLAYHDMTNVSLGLIFIYHYYVLHIIIY